MSLVPRGGSIPSSRGWGLGSPSSHPGLSPEFICHSGIWSTTEALALGQGPRSLTSEMGWWPRPDQSQSLHESCYFRWRRKQAPPATSPNTFFLKFKSIRKRTESFGGGQSKANVLRLFGRTRLCLPWTAWPSAQS